nr:conjugal transfer protein TraX [Leptotrichiaceae bacterium]
MDLFTLKLIGFITMFMDHYHYVIGGPEILTIVGRLSYPIFAFALVEG